MTEPADVIEPGRPWHGLETWTCVLCDYNDTVFERALEHTEKVHGLFFGVKPEEKVKTSLVGPSGRPLFMEVTDGN